MAARGGLRRRTLLQCHEQLVVEILHLASVLRRHRILVVGLQSRHQAMLRLEQRHELRCHSLDGGSRLFGWSATDAMSCWVAQALSCHPTIQCRWRSCVSSRARTQHAHASFGHSARCARTGGSSASSKGLVVGPDLQAWPVLWRGAPHLRGGAKLPLLSRTSICSAASARCDAPRRAAATAPWLAATLDLGLTRLREFLP